MDVINNRTVYKPGFQEGESLSADKLGNIPRETLARIQPGRGVAIDRTYGTIKVHAAAGYQSTQMPWVKTLPAIPTEGQLNLEVYWMSVNRDPQATGDDQVWTAASGDTMWMPRDRFTEKIGTPGTDPL